MRECKARRAVSQARVHSASVAAAGLEAIHDQGLLRRGKAISMRSVKQGGAGHLKHQHLAASTMLDIAACISSASEVARTFNIHQRTVRRIRALVAEVALSSQADTCERL
eukprot:8840290-Heterocapsa_arctica.AAC.1